MKPVTDWESRYKEGRTGWDIGHISTPLKEYFDQLEDKSIQILIPGAGNAYEAEYLINSGFNNIYVLDIAPSPLKEFAQKNPSFPKSRLIQTNFFDFSGQFDLIVEQTFFCAINPEHRKSYASKVNELLKPNGKLVGLLWSVQMNKDQPPYGGSKEEYLNYFDEYFNYIHFNTAYNSIKPRAEKELFILAEKKSR